MKEEVFLKNFIETIQLRIPQRGKLVDKLADILCIEKEAVYRRLRGSVAFSFPEIFKIALAMGFSLDSIAEGIYPVSRPFTMRMIEFLTPLEVDYEMLENFSLSVHHLQEDPNSESGAIGSIIPVSLCTVYKYIYKFYLFKWSCQFITPEKLQTYDETYATERLNDINKVFVESVRNSPKSIYIFDRRFLEFFVNDIQYFYDIRLISKEDISNLKADLLLFISDLERYAIRGVFDTGKRVEIYLANIHFESCYNYIDSKNYKLTMIRSFTLSDAYSFDEVIFRNMKQWLYFLKRTSTIISVSNVTERIAFFEKQRAIVNLL
jgi:hypothetical protein